MGKPGVPPYGKDFTLEHLRWDDWEQDHLKFTALRRYVSKANSAWFIRSNRDSKRWQVFIAGPAGAAFPHGEPHSTLRAAMQYLLQELRKITEPSECIHPGVFADRQPFERCHVCGKDVWWQQL